MKNDNKIYLTNLKNITNLATNPPTELTICPKTQGQIRPYRVDNSFQNLGTNLATISTHDWPTKKKTGLQHLIPKHQQLAQKVECNSNTWLVTISYLLIIFYRNLNLLMPMQIKEHHWASNHLMYQKTQEKVTSQF